jgi:hypothetical protein
MRRLLRAELVQVFKSFKMLWKTRSDQGKSEGEEGKAGPALAPWFFKAPELPSSSPNFADLSAPSVSRRPGAAEIRSND